MQFAQAAHRGGEPIWGGEHPPRVYSGIVPGGDHLPAWEALWQIAGMPVEDSGSNDISPAKFIPSVLTAFDGFKAGDGYPVDGPRVLAAKTGFQAEGASMVGEGTKSPEVFELLMVEWMFGTSEFSAWSDSLDAAVPAPRMSINSKDAAREGLSEGDTVSVELDGGAFEIVVSVSDKTAEGVLVAPRHQSLEWQKMKESPARISREKIKKI